MRCSPIATLRASVKRADPWMTVTPAAVRASGESTGAMALIASRTCCITRGKSTVTASVEIPNADPPRIAAAADAAAINAFDGTHPVQRQSPPVRSRSTRTTCAPKPAAVFAATMPAVPPPITNKSGRNALACMSCAPLSGVSTAMEPVGGDGVPVLTNLPEILTNGLPMRRPARYRASARFYDLISAEWPVYRAGRVAAIKLMELRPGDNVLDIGCGTGLNFAHLQRGIGPSGSITAVDTSAQMLRQARRRADSAGWNNVRLVEADATELDADTLHAGGGFDAVISTYALSLMVNWPLAMSLMTAVTRPGGRLAVVDMQTPIGWARPWTPLARLACWLGGSDIEAHPWTAVESTLTDVRAVSLRGGHIQVRVGSLTERS